MRYSQTEKMEVIRLFEESALSVKRTLEELDNMTPADVYFCKKKERLSVREMIKRKTLKMRRAYNMGKGNLKKQLQLTKITP